MRETDTRQTPDNAEQICPVCQKTFVGLHAVKIHFSARHPNDPFPWPRKQTVNNSQARIIELERRNAALRELLTDIRTFIYTVNQALMMVDGDNAQVTTLLDQIDKAIDKRAALQDAQEGEHEDR